MSLPSESGENMWFKRKRLLKVVYTLNSASLKLWWKILACGRERTLLNTSTRLQYNPLGDYVF
jgi:hypothetical protein